MPIYDQTAAHSFLGMLDPMAAHIIESVDVEPAPLRMVFGSQALETTLTTLRKRIAGLKRRLNSPLRRTSHRGITLATLRREYFATGANRENCP